MRYIVTVGVLKWKNLCCTTLAQRGSSLTLWLYLPSQETDILKLQISMFYLGIRPSAFPGPIFKKLYWINRSHFWKTEGSPGLSRQGWEPKLVLVVIFSQTIIATVISSLKTHFLGNSFKWKQVWCIWSESCGGQRFGELLALLHQISSRLKTGGKESMHTQLSQAFWENVRSGRINLSLVF